jgi:hypothetical protein
MKRLPAELVLKNATTREWLLNACRQVDGFDPYKNIAQSIGIP